MKKKILCALLCLGLCVPSVLAAESGFADVKDSDWFAPYVTVCVESGLMNGTGDGNFNPGGTITVAEVAAISARLRESSTGEAIPGVTPLPGETLPWYQKYVDYLTSNGVAVAEPTKNASRQDLIDLLSAVTPAGELVAINSITTLPDTADAGVLAFYNAGILTGTDDYGTFSPDRTLQRSEVSAMVARLVKSELRQTFTPRAASAEPSQGVGQEGEFGSQTAMTVNGQAATAQELAFWAAQVAHYWDSYYYSNFNTRLTWSEDVEAELMSQAETQCAAYILMEAKANELGCDVQHLTEVLTPNPTREQLNAYARANDLLCAKHILVAEEATAQSIIASLESQPTLEQFENILSILGTDPGMTSNPNGYLFTAGQMVEEFESETRALEFGAYTTQPVKSVYGYHVIWRLDPADHPDLISQYQEEVMNDFVDDALAAAKITLNQDVIEKIDLPATYENYLQLLADQQ